MSEKLHSPEPGFLRSRRRVLVMLGLGLVLGVTLALWPVIQVPPGEYIPSKSAKTSSLAMALQTAFSVYVEDQMPLPEGGQVEIVEALMGNNSGKRVYINLKFKNFNDAGEIVDGWGTPFSITVTESKYLAINSAGPDKTWHTQDDIDYSKD